MRIQDQKTSILKDINLYVIFGITLTGVMGVSSIAPAFPSISRSLGVSANQIGLLITFYTLPGIVLTPILGILADRIGRKIVLIPSLFLFGLAGTACAFATSFDQLLLFRVFQGMGSASLGALNLTLIGDLYSGNRRATAMGYNGSVLSVGTALYPAIGGALAVIGWNYPFFLSLLALPVALFVITSLDTKSVNTEGGLQVYFKEISTSLKSKKVLGLFTGIFFTFIILYGGYITFFTILLDEKFEKSSLVIGIILSASSFVTAYTSSRLGALTKRFTEQSLILIASVLYLAIFLWIPFVENIWFFTVPIALFGIAQGINIPSILNLLTGYAPSQYRAAFLSVNWVIMRLGQAFGPYILGIVYAMFSLQGTFFFTALVAGLFILSNLILLRPGR